MIRPIYILSLLFLLVHPVSAQNYTPVRDLPGFRSLYASKSAAMNTLKSDFIQEKTISLLKDKIISEGSFIYKKNNKIRMEYTKPYAFLFVMENDRITIKNDTKKSAVSVNANKMFKMISQVTMDCVTGNVLNSKDFSLEVTENAKVFHLVLVPRQKALRSLFGEIGILLSKTDFTVERLDLTEVSGDHTTLKFSNKKINTPVSDEVFKVINPLLLILAASGQMHAQNIAPAMCDPKDSVGLYNISIEVLSNSFSGVLVIKMTTDSTARIVMNTAMGPKLFDLELTPSRYKVIYAFPKLNRKRVMKTFYEDFGALTGILVKNLVPVIEKMQDTTIYTFSPEKKQKLIYNADTRANRIFSGRVERKKSILSVFAYDYTSGRDEISAMKLEHMKFKMILSLNRIGLKLPK